MSMLAKGGVAAAVTRHASRLRFPWLFGLTTALFVADLVVPDVIPFVDELLLGLVAATLGSWTERRSQRRAREDVAEGRDSPPVI